MVLSSRVRMGEKIGEARGRHGGSACNQARVGENHGGPVRRGGGCGENRRETGENSVRMARAGENLVRKRGARPGPGVRWRRGRWAGARLIEESAKLPSSFGVYGPDLSLHV